MKHASEVATAPRSYVVARAARDQFLRATADIGQELTLRGGEDGKAMLFDSEEMQRQLDMAQDQIRNYQGHGHAAAAQAGIRRGVAGNI